MILIRNFRSWWQVPRSIHERPAKRQVSFLELFYDLVYVVLIAELTHALAVHVDGEHIGNFVFLFLIVMWMWLNGTTYHEMHGNDDIRTRITTFLQMIIVAALAVFAHDALGEQSVGFALSWAAFQFLLAIMWWRTGVHDPDHRALSTPYVIAYLLATGALIGSVFVPLEIRGWIWLASILISIAMPFITFIMGRHNPVIREQIERSFRSSPSSVERLDLFTIIVLGEVIVGTVRGVAAHDDITLTIGVIGLMGMIVAFGLWWLYFDFTAHHPPIESPNWITAWLYTHIPITMGIAATGAALLNVVEHAEKSLPNEVRWLLVGAVAITLISIVVLIRTLQIRRDLPQLYAAGQMAIVFSAMGILALGLSPLETIPLLLALIVLLLLPIFFALALWLQSLDAGDGRLGHHDSAPPSAHAS